MEPVTSPAVKKTETAQELAQRILPDIEFLHECSGTLDCRTSTAAILGAVRQIADGRIQAVDRGIIDDIEKVRAGADKLGSWIYSVTCYNDVMQMRGTLEAARRRFPVMDEISLHLVDYSPRQTQEAKIRSKHLQGLRR